MGQDPQYARDQLCTLLEPKEQELLVRLMEEAGEVVQAASKVLRWGWRSTHPDGGPTNRQALERELRDVDHIVRQLTSAATG